MNNPFPLAFSVVTLSISILTGAFAQDADSANKGNAKEKILPITKVEREFMKMPQEKRSKFNIQLLKVQKFFKQKRIFDTLEGIDELDKIFPNHPVALNIKGACYVEIRAFDKARAIFLKTLKLVPDNTGVLFNLAEVDFVTRQWEAAHDRFEKLIPMLAKNDKAMARLCEFKLLLCKLKMGKLQEAKALAEKYDEWDDSPFYYYSHAAVLFYNDKKPEAAKMLRKVQYIWRNNATLAAWKDTLIEFGYIRSVYGNSATPEGAEGDGWSDPR